MLDALVIGGGPAGASCALWLTRMGHQALLADARTEIGGLLNDSPFRNDWIATQPGVTGPDLAEGIGLALAAGGVPLLLGGRAAKVKRIRDGFETAFELPGGSERSVTARNLVIATGVRARTGGLAASDRVLIGPGRHVAQQDFAGRRVAVLGGGDNAFENYQLAKEAGAAEVHIFARTVRARRLFAEAADPADVHTGAYEADCDKLTVNGRGYDLFLVMYGWEAVPLFVDELGLARDERGYLAVDFATCRTNLDGVYAIGEVAARSYPSVVTAMADGITAATAIHRTIEGA